MLCIGLSASALNIAQRADSAYSKDDFRLAAQLYTEAIDQFGPSARLYYNLGNAYYRLDKTGLAVVSYERALKLDPTDADARTNLEFVRARIQDKPEDDSAFLTQVHNSVLNSFKANTWAWIALVIFLLLAATVALYLFSGNIAIRKTGFFGGGILLLLFLYTLFMAWESHAVARSHEHAVVVVPSTQLSSTPRASKTANDKVVTIHEGTKVEVIDSISTPDDPVSPKWYNVKINNSTKAWLRSSDVERI